MKNYNETSAFLSGSVPLNESDPFSSFLEETHNLGNFKLRRSPDKLKLLEDEHKAFSLSLQELTASILLLSTRVEKLESLTPPGSS